MFRENTSEQLQNTTPNRGQMILKAHEYNNIRGKSTPEPLFFNQANPSAAGRWGAWPATGSSQSSNLKCRALNYLRRLLSAQRRALSWAMGCVQVRRTGCFPVWR